MTITVLLMARADRKIEDLQRRLEGDAPVSRETRLGEKIRDYFDGVRTRNEEILELPAEQKWKVLGDYRLKYVEPRTRAFVQQLGNIGIVVDRSPVETSLYLNFVPEMSEVGRLLAEDGVEAARDFIPVMEERMVLLKQAFRLSEARKSSQTPSAR